MSMHTEFMAFVNDEETAAPIRSWAEKQGFPVDCVRVGGADLFATLLESDAPPKVVLIDLDNQEQPARIATRLVTLCGTASRLIALDSANDVTLFRSLIAAGFADYLLKPLTPEVLTGAVQSAARGTGAAAGASEAKNIVFIGVRGGVGASTLAVNTAWVLAHEMKKKTVLLDLDLQYGTSALALDIEPGHGLRDVVSSPQRVDSLMIAGAMVNEDANLGVLSAEETIEDLIHVDPNAITALLKEMRTSHQALIVDMPRHMVATQKRVLATAHEIVLVSEMSLAGIRDCLRIRTTLKGLGSAARVTLVSAPVGPNHPAAVDEAAFAKGAQAKIDFLIPDDHKNVTAASNAGKMLPALASGAPVTKAIRDLARYLIASPVESSKNEKKTGGLFGFLKSGAKEAPKG